MRLNLSVIILALSLAGAKSQGANCSSCAAKFTPSTPEIPRAFFPKVSFRQLRTPISFEAPLPFPGSGEPPALASTNSSPAFARSAERADSFNFEAPLPFPGSGAPPALTPADSSPALVRPIESPNAVSFESPLPFPGSGDPPTIAALTSVPTRGNLRMASRLHSRHRCPFRALGTHPHFKALQ